MEKRKFKNSEVTSFLEELVMSELATEEEEEMYQDYRWTGKLDIHKYSKTIKKLLVKMRKYYEGEWY